MLTHCASPPVQVESPAEQTKRDTATGLELAHRMETELSFKQDAEVSVYLRKLAASLAANVPELRDAAIGVLVVQDKGEKTPRWRNFALPGYRVYLSVGLLHKLQYENELAAAIALELGHLVKRHAVRHHSELLRERENKEGAAEYHSVKGLLPEHSMIPTRIDYFSATGVFAFTDEERVEAAREAVGILYRAGYDPRGLTALWSLYERNGERSPYEATTLARLTEATRQAIAGNAPLRNPVVRSQAFIAVQKRIRKL